MMWVIFLALPDEVFKTKTGEISIHATECYIAVKESADSYRRNSMV